MPAFDGRGGRGGWVTVTPTNGWTGAVYYKVTSEQISLILDLFKAAWSAEIMVNLPTDAVPLGLPSRVDFWGMSRSSSSQAPVYLTAAGAIGCVLGSTTTGGGGIVGTLSIPR